MSNPVLPPELLDHIVDLLHDDVDTLRNCCLVSKPWIPGTRKHLFATVQFPSSKTLQAWKDVFLNASTSPARYTKSFVMTYPSDVGEGDWIPTFSRIKCLKVVIKDFEISVAPFQSLISSFPFLEDLSVVSCCGIERDEESNEQLVVTWPSILPPFTGFLELAIGGGMPLIASGLLSVPSGLHFRKLRLVLRCKEDIPMATALVVECSSTLESVAIDYDVRYKDTGPIDLSKAKMLRDATFVCASGPQWITPALRTITRNHRNFQQVSIGARKTFKSPDLSSVKDRIGESDHLAWLELDHFLAQLHESRSIRLKVLFRENEEKTRSCAEWLLPEVMAGGIVDLEKYRV